MRIAGHINKLVRLAAQKDEEDRGDGMLEEIGELGWHCGSLNLAIETHPVSKRPVLRGNPNALQDAIGMTVAQMLTAKKATVRVCRRCGKLFEVGPGTDGTRRAEFRTDPHRDEYHNEVQSEGR